MAFIAEGKTMNAVRVRTIHRGLGISIALFLFVQAIVGMLMSIGMLASIDTSRLYSILYSVHADWDPGGSIYRVVLGLATAMQAVLGIMIFRSRIRYKKREDPSRDQPYAQKEETPMHTPSFAADIRPLFRSFDVESMKPMGIDLSSYEDVKKHAPHIYARLSSGKMPCDGPWSEDHRQEFKKWMESRREP